MYGKLFTMMYDGTLVEDWRALITFQQMIVLCDSDGIVDMTPSSIARRTGIPLEHIEAGIKILESEDQYSRTAMEKGKRILLIDDHRSWGWKIVNHKYYRDLASREDKREKDRVRIARKRASEAHCSGVSQTVAECSEQSQKSPIQDTDTDTDKSKDLLPENLKVSMPPDFELNDTNKNFVNDSNLTPTEKHDLVKDFIDYWTLDESKKTDKGWQMAFRRNPIVKRAIVNSKHRGKNSGSHQQTYKPCLSERATENRKRAEREIDEQSLGENDSPVRP